MKNFNAVNNVLNRVMSKLGLDKRLREHTFLTLWPTFVSGAVEQRSRPLFIDTERNLVVAVADASTGQELSLLKGKIMSKLGPAARSLGIEIKGIRLDLKHYHTGLPSEAANVPSQAPAPKPEEAELERIVLTDGERQQVDNLRQELEAAGQDNEQTRRRIVRMFEREIRTRRWRFNNNFPICQGCGNPVERLHQHEGGQSLCIACFYS